VICWEKIPHKSTFDGWLLISNIQIEEPSIMEIKDKRFYDQMDITEQGKYTKDINDIITDVQDKLEECEITYRPINLLKKLKKAVDESQKEKASARVQDQGTTQEQ
jgi:hypothetical protein